MEGGVQELTGKINIYLLQLGALKIQHSGCGGFEVEVSRQQSRLVVGVERKKQKQSAVKTLSTSLDKISFSQ